MERAIIWGVAKNPPGLFQILQKKYEIVGWVDKNKSVQHRYLNEKYIYSPEELDELVFDKVIVGAAIFTGTRQIIKGCLDRGIKRENIITDYVLKTRNMPLREIFIMQHKTSKRCDFETFTRINLLIQYAFVEQFYGKNTIGYDLSDRYMRLVCTDERKENHKRYYEKLIDEIERNGFCKQSYVSVNRAGCLIDGTHRIACMLWKKMTHVQVDILNTLWNLETGGERSLEWMLERPDVFSQGDIHYLKHIYEKIKDQLEIDTMAGRDKRIDLWQREGI